MFSAVTRNIAVTVQPFYLADRSEPDDSRYVLAYRVTIDNRSEGRIKLLSRHWQITDAAGRVEEVRGAGVTLGYWRDPERTAAAFVALPAQPEGRVYRTGDLGVRDRDGLVHFLGRKDSQIKARGHRIELGEIEAALHAVPEIGQGVVVALPAERFGGHAICCAYVPRTELSPAAARELLAALVPRYMLPAHWRVMERLPTNANGKVDRVALRAMFAADLAGEPE